MLVSYFISWFGERAGVAIGKVLPYVLGILLVVGVVLGLRWDAYNDGVDDTTLKYTTLMEAERVRLSEANIAALTRANNRISELQRILVQRNVEINNLKNEAAQDPNADNPAIGNDSGLRLNTIR